MWFDIYSGKRKLKGRCSIWTLRFQLLKTEDPHSGFSTHLLNELISTWLKVVELPACRGVEHISKGLQRCLWNSKVDLLQTIPLEAGLAVTQERCSQRVFKSQPFRTQNTVFPTREVSDGYFLRAAHKSLLFHDVSERVSLHVLGEEWNNMGQNFLPTVPGDNAFYLPWRQPPELQWQEKETHFFLRGANPWYSLS